MKKLVSILSAASLVSALAVSTPAIAQESVYQRTLATFAGETVALTAQQRAQIKTAVESNPTAEKFICTGIRFETQPMSVNIMVRQRAKAACDYAKTLNPNLSTWFQNKPTKARSFAGKVLLTVKTPTGPIANIELNNYNPVVVTNTSLARVNEYYETVKNNQPIAFDLKAGPSVTSTQVATERARIAKSTVFWSSLYSAKPIAFLYSGADGEWMQSELLKLGDRFHGDLIRANSSASAGCALSLAVHTATQPYYLSCQTGDSAKDFMSVIPAHEFAHLPITSKFQNQPGGAFSSVPAWLNEGSAQFFGIALTKQSLDAGMKFWHQTHLNANSKVRVSTRTGDIELRDLARNITEAEIVELMTALEANSSLTSAAQYSMGHWAVELMIASGGMDKFIAFLDGMNSTTDWKSSFAKAYGMSVTDFYKSMTPYVKWIAATYRM
jgi:hypothetical protein